MAEITANPDLASNKVRLKDVPFPAELLAHPQEATVLMSMLFLDAQNRDSLGWSQELTNELSRHLGSGREKNNYLERNVALLEQESRASLNYFYHGQTARYVPTEDVLFAGLNADQLKRVADYKNTIPEFFVDPKINPVDKMQIVGTNRKGNPLKEQTEWINKHLAIDPFLYRQAQAVADVARDLGRGGDGINASIVTKAIQTGQVWTLLASRSLHPTDTDPIWQSARNNALKTLWSEGVNIANGKVDKVMVRKMATKHKWSALEEEMFLGVLKILDPSNHDNVPVELRDYFEKQLEPYESKLESTHRKPHQLSEFETKLLKEIGIFDELSTLPDDSMYKTNSTEHHDVVDDNVSPVGTLPVQSSPASPFDSFINHNLDLSKLDQNGKPTQGRDSLKGPFSDFIEGELDTDKLDPDDDK